MLIKLGNMVIIKLDIQSSVLTTNFTTKHIVILVIIIISIMLSAFFSMSETVFSSVNDVKLKTAVEERKSGSKKALYLCENFDKTLTTLLVGNNIVNTLMSVLAVTLFAAFIKNESYVSLVATAVMTVVLLIFGEIMPKTIGKKYCDTLCFRLSPFIYLLTIILYPIVIVFRGLQKLVSSEVKSDISEVELESIIDTMEEEGSIESDEVEYIKNIFDLNDRSIEDIMVHRMDVVAIDVTTPIEEVKNVFFESMFSRIPVYDGDKDHIIGILYERDFLKEYINKKNVNIKKLMRPAKYVNKAMKVDDLIHELQKCKMHMAIVLGEYGDTQGIVTMEDALEEIVGEIYDEHDEVLEDVNEIKTLEDGSYLVSAEIYVDYLYRELEIGDAPEDSTQKLASFLFEESEEIPEVGNQVKTISKFTKFNEETESYEDYTKEITFEIAEVEDNRIIKVKVMVADYVEEEE